MEIIELIRSQKIIAIIRLDDLTHAVSLAQALIAGGISIIEFTLTNPDAGKAIAAVRRATGDSVVIGAGSVITVEQVRAMHGQSAQFIVSPVTKRAVIDACHQYDLPTIPGAYTPTEIQSAWEMGVAAVKVFPARDSGARYIKDVLAPLPHLRLVPTGGIGHKNIKEYMDAGAFAVGIGSALFNHRNLATQNWDAITESTKSLVRLLD